MRSISDENATEAIDDAAALLAGDAGRLAALSRALLKPLKNNFVERPWGGMRIRDYKGLHPLPGQTSLTGLGLGEAFEICAWPADPEAAAHPSRLRLDDGSELSLDLLLARHGAALLGPGLARAGGLPLLPKTLDIKELLSVQGHPEGNTEVYVIIEAEPGATLRLGFREDIDAATFAAELRAGREQQARLLGMLEPGTEPARLQMLLAPWLAERTLTAGALREALQPSLAVPWPEAGALLEALKRLYWRVLDAMNAIPVEAGQVLHNANPERIVAVTGRAPSAEVHALGNPERREILALEIRRPGPTFRAWDNVRFPIRDVDVEAAIGALNLRRTSPEEFIVEPQPLRPGVLCSVDSRSFRLEHLRPAPGAPVDMPAEPPHCLHAIAGSVVVHGPSGECLGTLDRGEAALVPAGVRGYRVGTADSGAEVVKVSLPEGA